MNDSQQYSPVRERPETLRLRAVSPLLTVNDVEKSVEFYRDILGFIVAEEWKHDDKLIGASLRAGNVEFMVGADDFKKGRDRVKGEGLRFYCTTVQDVDQLAEEIEARGGKLEHGPTDQEWGARDFGIVDPDGFKISIAAASSD